MSLDRHPLTDLLTDAEDAVTYEVPVELVRARVRVRRRRVVAAQVAGALVAVTVVAVSVPGLTTGPDEGVVAGQGVQGDLAARCGEAAPADEPGTGPLEVRIENARDVVRTDRVALVTIEVASDPAEVAGLELGSADVALVRDGVVVGLGDPDAGGEAPGTVGTHAPVVVDTTELAVAEPAVGVSVHQFGSGLAPCADDPALAGATRVPVGRYGLVVTQAVTWRSPAGRVGTTVVTRTLPVTVSDEPVPMPQGPTTCGTGTAALTALAGGTGPVRLDAVVPPTARAGGMTTVRVTAATDEASVLLGRPSVVVARDGVVVGGAALSPEGTGVRAEPGAPARLDLTAPLVGCDGADGTAVSGPPLGAGTYEVWVVIDVVPDGATGTSAPVAAGPWPLEVG